MKKKDILRTFLAILAISATFLVFSSARPGKPDPCKESLDSCCKPPEKSGKMIWENLPRQFFSSI